MIEVGILKNFDSGTYKAGAQLAGSLTTYFDDISVARNIPSSALVIGNYIIVAIPGGNPGDACVIATWPQGSPGGGMEVHGNEYHSPPFMDCTLAPVSLYVDDALGNDENDGSSGSPKATILGALNALPVVIAHPATICVRPSSYPEGNTLLNFDRFNTLDYITIKTVNSNDENMYDNGLATGGGNNYLDDSGKSWSADQFNGAYIWIYAGTGRGQIRTISDTTSTRITVTTNWTTNPDATSCYAIGGGAALTGTDKYHLRISTKKVKCYGFRHTGATTADVRIEDFGFGYVYYNYFQTSVEGTDVTAFSYVWWYYNYSAATLRGLVSWTLSSVLPRASVFNGATRGLYLNYGSIGVCHSATALINYFDACTTGIYIATGAGCPNASLQVFNACGTNIDPAVSITVPRWWT